ncbi:MAG: hypothetical protein BWZ01_02597 [Deltaproteobacteria bacterium ADurb.BinA179]|jgi:hypothetical protein|nr:hypothetical protein [Deltaproteobacteria bacterium]MDI9543064.1 hypothetical protein [Pseudomonadota bacterium]NLW67420.1 hypothetical protein [Bacteriovoracaceae bacterium]OPZ25195.1 MAG: hypothetical protein BWZ01_02597 [Deltaproteobacteria bacterium ADurb.BinA179]HRR20563.1 hypothetical protein [Desulfomonilia bacterium]
MDRKTDGSPSDVRWALWRQDDNGHRYIVCVTRSREEAELALKNYEAHHHKQYYFIEPLRQ